MRCPLTIGKPIRPTRMEKKRPATPGVAAGPSTNVGDLVTTTDGTDADRSSDTSKANCRPNAVHCDAPSSACGLHTTARRNTNGGSFVAPERLPVLPLSEQPLLGVGTRSESERPSELAPLARTNSSGVSP